MKKYRFIDEGRVHVHTLDGQPLYGTSSIVGILAKPLTWWAVGLGLATLGWTATQTDPAKRLEASTVALEVIKELNPVQWLKRLDAAYKAHNEKKKDSAEAGTDMHAELEKYVKTAISNGGAPFLSDDLLPKVQMFARWAHLNIEIFLFAEGHTFSEKHWVGGIVDCGAKMKDGSTAIIDFKSSKEVYYSQMVQTGGYAVQVEETGIVDAQGNHILKPMKIDELVVVALGNETIRTRAAQNVEAFTTAFIGALENYKLSKAFEAK